MKKRVYFIFLCFISLFMIGLSGCNEKSSIESISLDTTSINTTISINSEFDFSGLKGVVKYIDGTTKDIVFSDMTIDSSKIDSSKVGVYEVSVKYQNFETSFKVEVIDAITPKSLEITPSITSFIIGEDFSYNDLSVKVKMSDGSQKYISDYTVDSSKYKADTAGEYNIVISYKMNNVEVKGNYTVYVVANISDLVVDVTNVKLDYNINEKFSSNGLKVSAKLFDDSLKEIKNYEMKITDLDGNEVSGFNKTGVYKLKIEYFGFVVSYDVNVTENGYFTVFTIDDFIKMREYANSNNYNDKKWILKNDLDFTGVELKDLSSTLYFSGEFNGNNHKLSNISYNAASSKVSPLFQYIDGGTIKNLIIFGATVSSSSESIGIISGQCNDAIFENIEFSCCTVISTSSSGYAALLSARNQKGTVNITNITVKNLTSISGIKYVGGLLADATSSSKININNCDINVTLSGGSQIATLVGRARAKAEVNVENTVIRLNIAKYNSATTKVGGLIDGCDGASLNAKNVCFISATVEDAVTASGLFVGNNKAGLTCKFENCYYDKNATFTTDVLEGVTSKDSSELNFEFFKNDLKLDSNIWSADSRFIIKLTSSSSNTPDKDATISKLILITTNVDKQYFKGEDFSQEGLIVTAQYSDGVVIALDSNDYNIVIKNGSTIVTDFTSSNIGKYSVIVEAENVKEEFIVNIVEETGITINNDFTRTVFKKGEALDLTNLAVFIEISDGTHVLSSSYTVKILDEENNKCDSNSLTAGNKTVVIEKGNFKKTYVINVIDRVEKEVVNVYVNKDYTDGKINSDHIEFSTIKKALDYLVSLQLADDTYKVIYISSGTYNEKITVTLPNTTLIGLGESYKDVVINYNAASDTLIFDESKTYGTEGSATVTIKSSAYNFRANRIYFKNSFDYNNSKFANKQALALFSQADKSMFVECGFISVQDTLEPKQGRQYYYKCYIAGSVDFIFGNNATAIFDSCEIHNIARYDSDSKISSNQGYIAAPKGYSQSEEADTVKYNYVFMNCNFTADDNVPTGSVSLARPWGSKAGVVILNSKIGKHISILGYDGKVKSRYDQMSGNLPANANFYEYGNTGEGAINTKVDGMTILTGVEAGKYTYENIFAQKNGLVDYKSEWKVNNENTSEIVYNLINGNTEYEVNQTFINPVLVLSSIDEVKISTVTLNITDANNNQIKVEEVTKKAGKYLVKVLFNNEPVLEYELTVKAPLGDFEEKVYELNASLLTIGDITANTIFEDFFTVNANSEKKVTIDANNKELDGISFTQRMKFNGNGSSEYRNITFTIKGTAKVVIYSMSSSSSATDRTVNVCDASGNVVFSKVVPTSALEKQEVELEAGTYYITCLNGAINVYNVVVTVLEPKAVTTTPVTYKFDASSLTAKDIVSEEKVNEFFTIKATSDKKVTIDANSKEVDGVNFTQRMKLNGNGSADYRNVTFTAKGKVKITIYSMSSSSSESTRTVDICDTTGKVIFSKVVPTSSLEKQEVELEAGTYYITCLNGAINIYGIDVVVEETK